MEIHGQLRNQSSSGQQANIEYRVRDANGVAQAQSQSSTTLKAGEYSTPQPSDRYHPGS